MDNVAVEEPKIPDPSVSIEPDLRLTMKEWVLYWKVRYENSLQKIVQATKLIDRLRDELRAQVQTIAKLKAENKAMQEQYSSEVAARQAKQTEGRPQVPSPSAEEFEPDAKPKAFKRKKGK